MVSTLGLGESNRLKNAYKTIFSRITKASEIEGTLFEDISKAEGALRGIGVEVRDSNDDFRDMSDIMADIGQKWDSLTDTQKANVGFEVAGTRQLNVLNSLFGAWDQYSSIMGDVDDRAGTTLENQYKYANSIQGRLGDIASTVNSIWNNVFETDDFKDALKTFNEILEKIDGITGALGSVGSLGLVAGAYLSKKDVG